MFRRPVLLLVLLVLWAAPALVTASDPSNTPHVRYGQGVPQDVASASGRGLTAVATTIGVWLHAGDAPPILINEDAAQGGAVSVAFSPDETTLAVGGEDGTIALWNMDALARTFHSPSPPLHNLASGEGGEERPRLLTGHLYRVVALRYFDDGATLGSFDTSGVMRVWTTSDLDAPPAVVDLNFTTLDALPTALRPILAGLQQDDVAALRLAQPLRAGYTPPLEAVGLRGDTVFARAQAAPYHFRLDQRGSLLTLPLCPSVPTFARPACDDTIYSRPDDSITLGAHTLTASAQPDGTTRITDESGVLRAVLRGHRRGVTSVAWSAGCRREAGKPCLLASASLDATVNVYTMEPHLAALTGDHAAPLDLAPDHTLRGHLLGVTGVLFDAQDGVYSSSYDGTIRVWGIFITT